MCTRGIRDRVSIDTVGRHLDRPSTDNRSILDRDSMDMSVASRSTVDMSSQTRRRVSMDTSGDHTFTVGRHSADGIDRYLIVDCR